MAFSHSLVTPKYPVIAATPEFCLDLRNSTIRSDDFISVGL